MSEVITLRVSRETKRLMNQMDINWSEEIRGYIEGRTKSFHLHGLLNRIKKNAKQIKVNTDSTRLVRADRDAR